MRSRSRLGLVASTLTFVVSSLFACGDDGRDEPHQRDSARKRDAGADVARDAAPPAPKNVIGDACETNDDCGAGSCLKVIQIVNTPYPGGYCTAPCRTDNQCGEGAVCIPGQFGRMGSCYLGCDETTGCVRDGYLCRVASGVARCVPGSKPLPDGTAGNACTSDDDCGGGANTCAEKIGNGEAPGGYCSQWCAIDSDCGAGGKCINGISIVTVNSGTCYRSCNAPEDCRPEYECRSISGLEGSPGVCVVNNQSE
jgi:Cys-rich repeat protein